MLHQRFNPPLKATNYIDTTTLTMNRSINTVNECLAQKAQHGRFLPPTNCEEHLEIMLAFQEVHDDLRAKQGHRVRFTCFNQVVLYDKNSTKGLGFI